MGLRKSIGRMGSLTKTGITKAKHGYNKAKPHIEKAAKSANKARERLVDYSARVNDNLEDSYLLNGNHERQEHNKRKHKHNRVRKREVYYY